MWRERETEFQQQPTIHVNSKLDEKISPADRMPSDNKATGSPNPYACTLCFDNQYGYVFNSFSFHKCNLASYFTIFQDNN